MLKTLDNGVRIFDCRITTNRKILPCSQAFLCAISGTFTYCDWYKKFLDDRGLIRVLVEGVWHDAVRHQRKRWQVCSWRRGLSQLDREQSWKSAVWAGESGRYHLYVSLALTWRNRTLVFRELKDLTDHIDVTVVCPDMMSEGWQMGLPEPCWSYLYAPNLTLQAKTLTTSGWVTFQCYGIRKPTPSWVTNSSEIIRMFNSEFNELTGNTDDYYPWELS